MQKEELLPNISISHLQIRLEELKALVNNLKNEATVFPSGRLRIAQRNNHPEFYLVLKHSNEQGRYIHKENHNLAVQLAQKDYNYRILKLINKEIAYLQNYMKQTDNGKAIQNLFEKLSPVRQHLIKPVTLSDNLFLQEWLSITWQGLPFPEDAADLFTENKEKVRSKSEVIIANKLFNNDIPYRYECPLTLYSKGNKSNPVTIYPDFTCLNVHTHKEFYWEHFGLLDNPEYAQKTARKLRLYAENNYFPGRNLIITMETQTEQLSTRQVEQLIEEFLK